eukprot:733454-Rhodomonas_salina.5
MTSISESFASSVSAVSNSKPHAILSRSMSSPFSASRSARVRTPYPYSAPVVAVARCISPISRRQKFLRLISLFRSLTCSCLVADAKLIHDVHKFLQLLA